MKVQRPHTPLPLFPAAATPAGAHLPGRRAREDARRALEALHRARGGTPVRREVAELVRRHFEAAHRSSLHGGAGRAQR